MASLGTSELLFGMVFFKKFTDFIGTDYDKIFAPSTVAEGNPNEPWAGTDLVINDFCLQLKMSEEIYRNRTIKEAYFNGDNYFQFQVKNKPNKQNACQLNLLVNIAANNPDMKVLYAAPYFENHFSRNRGTGNNFWFNGFATSSPNNINNFVAFFDIRSIPPDEITNDNNHKIKFSCSSLNRGYGLYFSEPKSIKSQKLIKNESVDPKVLFQKSNWNTLQKTFPTVSQKITLLKESFKESKDYTKIEQMPKIEFLHYLASAYGIYWLPLTASHEDYYDFRITNQLDI